MFAGSRWERRRVVVAVAAVVIVVVVVADDVSDVLAADVMPKWMMRAVVLEQSSVAAS